jgi:EmrB/QacA subfamily drug resistance transporter
MGSATNIALRSIGTEFSIGAVLLGWVSTIYTLAAAICLVPLGKIADMHGRKRIFTYGISIYTFASLLCALANSTPMLIGGRALQGVGSAMIFGTGVAILTSVFPPGERGQALGLNVTATYTGLSLGPFLGGFLTETFGWRSIFLFNVPVGLLVIILVVWKLTPEWASEEKGRFDVVGSSIYAASLLTVMYGLSRLPETAGLWLLPAGLAGGVAFVWWEMRAAHPVLNMTLFRGNPGFAFSNLAALINYAATTAVGFLLSYYLQYVKLLTPQQAGLVLVAQPVMMAVFSPLAGWLSDRIESRVIASTGMGVTAIALALLTLVDLQTPIVFVIVCQVILGFGFALFSSPNVNAIMSSVERRHYGIASAMVGTMRLIGQMLSMGVAMLILALYVGDVEITSQVYADFLTSLRTAFIIFSALCFAGVFASMARGKIR